MESLAQEAITLLVQACWGVVALFREGSLLSLINIAGALLVLMAARLWHNKPVNRTFLSELAPGRIWSRPSIRVDIALYLLLEPFKVFLFAAVLVSMFQPMAQEAVAGITAVAGPSGVDPLKQNSLGEKLAYTVILFLAKDFGFFFSHYLSHRWPLLWCFHKVHHSAPVLTPVTAMRFHPLDTLWNMAWGIGLTVLASALCQYSFYNGERALMLFGNNLVVAVAFLSVHNLRHSHLWLHFPPGVARWLVSPAMHQLHHSAEPRHWDKNLGYMFAGWDRLFGIQYIPHERETFRLGVYENEHPYRGHETLRGALIAPFREAAGLMRARWRRGDSRQEE